MSLWPDSLLHNQGLCVMFLWCIHDVSTSFLPSRESWVPRWESRFSLLGDWWIFSISQSCVWTLLQTHMRLEWISAKNRNLTQSNIKMTEMPFLLILPSKRTWTQRRTSGVSMCTLMSEKYIKPSQIQAWTLEIMTLSNQACACLKKQWKI